MIVRVYLELKAHGADVERVLIDNPASITTTQHIREHWRDLKDGKFPLSAEDPFKGYREYGQCAQISSTFHVRKGLILSVEHEQRPRGSDYD